jgi:hypothetical protein
MSKKNENPSPFEAPMTAWEADTTDILKNAKTVAQVNEEQHLVLPNVKAAELVDQTFIIVSVKQFPSSFPTQDHAYFCGCLSMEGVKFTTVLGGMTIVEFLDNFTALNEASPLKVTLRHVNQGSFGGYYALE